MVKCSQCGECKSFLHYSYYGSSKPFVNFPTCRKCFDKARKKPKNKDDIRCSDELALFKIEKLTKRVRKLVQESVVIKELMGLRGKMRITDLYRNLCNKLGKGKVWAMSNDELCDYIEENYNVQEKEIEGEDE